MPYIEWSINYKNYNAKEIANKKPEPYRVLCITDDYFFSTRSFKAY